MDSYILTFIISFCFFTILNFVIKTNWFRGLLKLKRFYVYTTFLIVLCLFFSAAILKKEVADVMLFSGAGWYFRHGIDFYWIDSNHSQYPFFPFLIFFFIIFNFLTENFSFLTFSFYLKAFLLIPALFYLSWCVLKKIQSQSIAKARQTQLEFLTSPISYAAVLFHGQIDVVLLALFFLSARLFLNQKKEWKRLFLSAIFYAASIASKTWSILLFPLILRFQKKLLNKLFFILTVVIFLLGNVFIYTRSIFGSSFSTVLPAVLTPRAISKTWGLSFLFSRAPLMLDFFIQYKLYIFLILFSFMQFLIWKKNISFWPACLLTIMGIYVIIPNWAPQYLFWILPFLFLFQTNLNKKKVMFFKYLSAFYIFSNYLLIIFQTQVRILLFFVEFSLLILWIFIFYWFLDILFNKYKLSRLK